MAQVRFVGAEPHHVPWLGRTVEPDEVVTVPDGQFESYVCQPLSWQAVEEPKKTKAVRGGRDGD